MEVWSQKLHSWVSRHLHLMLLAQVLTSKSELTFALKVSKKKGNRGKSEGLLDNHD